MFLHCCETVASARSTLRTSQRLSLPSSTGTGACIGTDQLPYLRAGSSRGGLKIAVRLRSVGGVRLPLIPRLRVLLHLPRLSSSSLRTGDTLTVLASNVYTHGYRFTPKNFGDFLRSRRRRASRRLTRLASGVFC